MIDSEQKNLLGMPLLSHWVDQKCGLVAPGDIVTDTVSEVDCPVCLEEFDRIRQGQAAATVKRKMEHG